MPLVFSKSTNKINKIKYFKDLRRCYQRTLGKTGASTIACPFSTYSLLNPQPVAGAGFKPATFPIKIGTSYQTAPPRCVGE
jgi:hypothetical protein